MKNVPVIDTEAEQWRIIRECHEGIGNSVKAKAMSGHFGRDKTVALIQSKVYFPGFRQKTIEFIKSCVACQHVKCGGKFEKGGEKLKPIPVPRKDDGNGNYLLKSLSGKNKGQISKKSYPPNHIKRFIHRNPEIRGDSDSEYGSDNEGSVPASQDSAIRSQESVPENPSHISSDATTVLYSNPEEGDTLLSCTLVDNPGHTLPKMMAHIPICTPSCSDDEVTFLPDLVETEPTTPVSVCKEGTLSAA